MSFCVLLYFGVKKTGFKKIACSSMFMYASELLPFLIVVVFLPLLTMFYSLGLGLGFLRLFFSMLFALASIMMSALLLCSGYSASSYQIYKETNFS